MNYTKIFCAATKSLQNIWNVIAEHISKKVLCVKSSCSATTKIHVLYHRILCNDIAKHTGLLLAMTRIFHFLSAQKNSRFQPNAHMLHRTRKTCSSSDCHTVCRLLLRTQNAFSSMCAPCFPRTGLFPHPSARATLSVRIRIYVYRDVYTYRDIYIYIHMYIHIYTCIYLHTYIYIYICIHMYVCIYVYIYIYMYMHIHVYIQKYVCIYRYTYIHVYVHR